MLQKLSIVILCATLASCGGGGGTAQPAPPPAPTVTLTAPVTQVLAGGQAVTISAAVSGGGAVSWELAAGAPGSLTASGATVQYLPPASVATNTQVVLTARAGNISQSVTLHLYADPGPAGLYHVAGALGERALLDGPGDMARFNRIYAVAAAQDGSLLVADRLSGAMPLNALRRVGQDRKVTTLLRSAPGHADGALLEARFGEISSVAQTANGAIWLRDHWDGKPYLRRLSGGLVSTVLEGAQWGKIGQLRSAPGHMLYLATATAILRMPQDGSAPELLAGALDAAPQQADGSGGAARFNEISDLAVAPSGELFAIDGCSVRKITSAGVVTTLNELAHKCLTRLQRPEKLAVNAAGEIQVLIRDNAAGQYLVKQIAADDTASTLVAELGSMWFSPPQGLRFSAAGELLLVREAEIRKVSGNQLLPYAGLEDDSRSPLDGVGAAARFLSPAQLSADRAGNIYALDDIVISGDMIPIHDGIRLRKITADGRVTTLLEGKGRPAGIANGPDGTLYLVVQTPERRVPENPGGAIYKVGADGSRTLLAGREPGGTPEPAQVDGQGAAARFTNAWMAGVDADGNIYVTDAGKVRQVTPAGLVTTVATLPANLGKAPDGFRYQINPANSSVVRVNADGSQTVVAGGAGITATVLGALPGGLNTPRAIVPTGPYTFAVTSGSAILKLVLPR